MSGGGRGRQHRPLEAEAAAGDGAAGGGANLRQDVVDAVRVTQQLVRCGEQVAEARNGERLQGGVGRVFSRTRGTGDLASHAHLPLHKPRHDGPADKGNVGATVLIPQPRGTP